MPNKKRTGAAQNARFSPEKHFPTTRLTKYEAISLANWLIRFTALDVSTFRERDWRNLYKDLADFIRRSTGLTDLRKMDYSHRENQNPQADMKGYFDDLRDGYNKGFQLTSEHHFTIKGGKLFHEFRHEYSNAPYAQAFFFTLLNIGDKLRVCQNAKCRKFFVATKRQAYCSPECSQSVRTLAYRKNNPEKFRKKRRDYYRRKQQEAHPN